MANEIKIPDLGDGVESGDVLEVFVSDGDTIEKGQDLIELETDKATVTVPATVGGLISKVHVAEGDTISVGGTIVTVESDSPSDTSDGDESASETAHEPEAEQPAASEAASPKPANVDSSAPASSERTETQPAEKVQQRTPEETTAATPAPMASAETTVQPPAAIAAADGDGSQIAAGPAIRRLAREVGIDLGTVTGTGEFGRITRDDLMKAVRDGAARKVAGSAAGASDGHGPIRVEKMPRIRQTIARKMHESWQSVPRVTNFDDADVTDLEEIRQNSKKDYAARDIKLTTMPFIIKAVAMSLKSHPIINASVDLDEGTITYKEYINIGIAVDTDRGLVVPSLRNADSLAIPDIARQLSEMADNVRDNNFEIEDLRGSTFTISNLGAIGGTYSTPIINVPETAILLIGRSRRMPVVIGDEIKIRLMMPLSISYDHRLIDGGAAARFLNEVKGYLEAPSRLLLAL